VIKQLGSFFDVLECMKPFVGLLIRQSVEPICDIRRLVVNNRDDSAISVAIGRINQDDPSRVVISLLQIIIQQRIM